MVGNEYETRAACADVEWNLRILGVSAGVRTLGNALYFPFLALFLHSVLKVGYLDIGVIFFGVGIVQLPFSLAGGLWTDRYGRRRMIIVGLVAEAMATAGLAYAFALQSLAGAIIAGGAGGIITTAAGPATGAYVADFATGTARTQGFTFLRVGFNAGYSAGVTLGGVLISVIGFAPAVAVAAVIIASGAGIVGVLLASSPYDQRIGTARPSARVDGGVRAGGASSAPGLGGSLRALSTDRTALELAVAMLCAALFVGQWSVTFPLYVRNVLGIPYSTLGVGLALNGLVVVFGQTATTESVVGRRLTTIGVVGVGLYAVAFLALGASGLWSFDPTIVFFASVIVLTVGENLITIPQTTLPSNLAPPGEIGLYNGAFGAFLGAGSLGSVLLGGWVLSLTGNPLLVWVLLAAPGVPGVLLMRHAAARLSSEVDRA